MNWSASLFLLGLISLNTHNGYADDSLTVLCIGNHDSTGICKPEESNMEADNSLDCILSSPGLVSCEDENNKISYNCILAGQISRHQSQFACQPVSGEEDPTASNQIGKNQMHSKLTISSDHKKQEVEDEPKSKSDMEESFRSTLGIKKNDTLNHANMDSDSKLFESAF